MSRKTLLVACGGSGIKTLMRFNEMMAGNDEWRKRLPNDVAYLIIDTEVDLTNDFVTKVRNQMGDIGESGMPLIRLLQITKGLNSIGQIVDDVFYGHDNDPAYMRLRPHWWFNPDGRTPFRAQYIRDIERGAGQSCPVSYLCTWKALPQFEKVLADLLDNLARRNMHENRPLENMQVFFVAGLAGGTGRGTWMPTAFKVRKFLEDRGFEINPTGIFFERGCYPNVGVSDKDQDLGMKVNTVTGLSELSSWMRVFEGKKYFFSLPNLMEPGFDPNNPTGPADTDVIKVDPDEKDPPKRSPLNSAYLICDDAGHGHLEDNDQYHQMVGAALYTLVAGSQIVGSTAINKLKNFGSLGANTFEVETVLLKAYFESFLRMAAVEAVCRKAGKGDALDKAADEVLASLEDEENPLHGLDVFSVKTPVGAADISAASQSPRVVSRAIGLLRAQNANIQQSFIAQMKKQKPKDVWQFVVKTLAASTVGKDKVEEALDQILSDLKVSDLCASLGKLVETAYSNDRMKASFGRAIAAIEKMETVYENSIANLDKPIVFGKDSYKKDKDLLERFKPEFDEMAKRNTIKEKFTFTNFTESEQKYLADKFAWLYNCALFFKIRPLLKKRFETALASLGQVKSACALLSKTLAKVQKEFEKQTDAVVGARRGEAFNRLFTAPTTPAMLADIPLDASAKMMYRRVLKPIMTKDDVRKLLLAEDSCSMRTSQIDAAILAELKRLLSLKKTPEADYVAEMQKSLERTFGTNVFLGKDFMDANFSFDRVLKANIPHWNDLIADMCGNMFQYEDLRRRLQDYIGVDLAADGDVENPGELPPRIRTDSLIERIALSMVSTCRPWVQLNTRVALKDLETIVLLPIELTDNRTSAFNTEIKTKHDSQNVSVFHHGSTTTTGCLLPPDRIVVFASQCISAGKGEQALDLVQSVSRMWAEAKVKAALEDAEKVDAKAYFEKDGEGYEERRRGLGFVSPIYVNEPLLANHRWRPWKKTLTVDDVEELNLSIDRALLYAFLGSNANREDEQAILGDIAERFHWGLPLLEMGKGKSEDFTFTREPLVWKNGRGEEDVMPVWEAGETVITSIDKLYDYLAGGGKPGLEGSKLLKAQEDGAKQLKHLLSEAEAFEKQIVPSIGATALDKLRSARNKWLTARERSASKEDKPFWKRLQAAAKGQ